MEPKRFLFISLDNLCGDLAWTIKEEGHEIKYFVQQEDEREVGKGFFEHVDAWESYVDWADVIVFDDVLGQGTLAKKLRRQGKAVIGGTPYTDKLEDSREFGQQELKKKGITIIHQWTFRSFEKAIKFVKNTPGRYVLKPSGEAQNLKGLLFVGEEDTGKDLIQVMKDYKKAWSKKIPQFQLQRRIPASQEA